VLAATARVTRDLDLAEECVQDAYVSALAAWERGGVPDRPGAWLTTAARRTALNALQRDRTLRSKLPLLVEPEATDATDAMPEPEPDAIPDDRLRLVFTCCHPALAQEAQVALTLRLVCGVATADIADAFLVSEPTMAARLTRAKKKIAAARIPFAVPAAADLPARLDAALTVVHLLGTTGHTAPSGDDLVRVDLLARAVDLARMLVALLPGDPEARGLLALLLIHQARRDARTDAAGRLVVLAEQDRSLWDGTAIADAHEHVDAALRAAPPGRFTLQAAIAALHAQAPSWEETDWPQIVTLYGELEDRWPSPVVALNRVIAESMVDGPAAALQRLEALARDKRLARYRYLPAARADMLRRLGRAADAAAAYREALELTANGAEREFLEARLAECRG
jgi:RNA polymerase sigma-70 factor (ECF subfamily)